MDDLERERQNARRRELYAIDPERRSRRRKQAESWRRQNRTEYLAQQRDYARAYRASDGGREASRLANKKFYDENTEARLAATKAWRAKNPGYHSRWHAANKKKNPVLYMWRNCKNRARRINVEFSIKQGDIIVPEICPVLGLKMEFGHGKGFFSPESPSVDRVDNSKGYTKENIRVISWRANMLKHNATIEEMERVLAYMKGQR